MAENTKGETAPGSLPNLTCPFCLNIFDEATLLACGHTFCRKCLKEYDLSHQDRDHMVCPLCREITKLMDNRVDDFPANVSVNGLVDNYYGNSGGISAVLEINPKCTSCKFQGEAVSFCRTCSNYMCEECLLCHQRLSSVFEGHEIVAIEDIIKGNVSIGQDSEKCLAHRHENRDLFCEDCKVHVCLKCVIIRHRDHKIKSQEDFKKELQLKVNDLIQRCTSRKSELEKNIQTVETQRHEVHSAIKKLREDVSQAYNIKAERLEENHRILLEQIEALHRDFDKDLDALRSSSRCKIKSICSSVKLVANDRLGRLETDSLSAHTLLCEELDGILKEATDDTSLAAVMEKVQNTSFIPADDTSLNLGNIAELPNLKVSHCVYLRTQMCGMTKYSNNELAFTYNVADSIDMIDSTYTILRYPNIPSGIKCYGLVFQNDETVCVTTSTTKVVIYSNGSVKSTINVPQTYFYPTLSRSPLDEILIANAAKEVYIYDPTGTSLKHTVPTKQNITRQASATRDGLIVSSSCSSNPSMVTVYDRDGNAGKPLRAPEGIHLYATVDEQDRVYVASVDCKNGKVMIRLYNLDGLNLKERALFNELNLTLLYDWCYLVSLSPTMLAFAYDKKLYFIKVFL